MTNELKVPAFLENDEIASAEFKRVIDNYKEIGLLDNLDLTVLAGYANAYSHYVRAVEDTQKRGDMISRTDKKGVELLYQNPSVKIADTYYAQMLKASLKLGLTSVDRLKLVDADSIKRGKNKFTELLEKRNKR